MPRKLLTCQTCINRDCGHGKGQPACGHYNCLGDAGRVTRNSCPGVPAGRAVVQAQADAIRNMLMAGISPEARAAVYRLQNPAALGEPDCLRSDLRTALAGILDAFPGESGGQPAC
jgi:hypothetical protein